MRAPAEQPAIQAVDLVKEFDGKRAVDGVSFAVPPGRVLGLLGPNGAGKTTTVRMMTTLLRPTSGTARIAGYDVLTQPDEVRRRMGVIAQSTTVDEILSGRENLRMIGSLYGITGKRLAAQVDALLAQFLLTDAADRAVKTYSGGMRRRLDLAAGLLASPPVLFLDEPTTGLDPRSRLELWDVLRELVRGGTTLLLTTQYLEEVDRLADEIVVMDHGRIVATGTPLQLKDRAGSSALEVIVANQGDVAAAAELIRTQRGEVFRDEGTGRLTAPAESIDDLIRLATALAEQGIAVDDIALARPTLDDVFLSLTGHRAEPVASQAEQ
ncbi:MULTISPECIES: ATP-binding cassette domain-containing protein [unclassified Crossiella]|uniref:ATP-binding cassette domain-containing protein n=1 Tax=unclassified Crossiella TaxID=2620835 RepID=UPI001FFFCB9A|nr:MULTISPECIES: ATP-binding cassette domain-containing protein [unclassified Crossiella]MCK2244568.1 ATP-binding cassette domain-containing protein [Crossiella sp. S99.2]MCK2258199.1 ATP-binding cassette domain-containing protein [Crossiella sp. S99.1]